MLSYIIFYIIILLLIPIFDVILKNIKNILNWRKTLNIFQTYNDLIKLFKKENFKSEFTSFISSIAPIFILAISLTFLFFIPIVNSSIDVNIIVLFHILWLWAFFLMIYALDNATYFWGLWAAREAFVLAIIEPVTILLILGFVIIGWWNTDIAWISEFINSWDSLILHFFHIILIITLFAILLAENKRFPFDNPSTHLELTMIHEAMLLETSWPRLAIMEIASKVTLISFTNLIIFLTWTNSYWLIWNIEIFLLHIVKIIFILFIIWFFEVFITKMRLFKYQNVFWFLLIIEIITILFYLLNN
jgi:formate hydrogenlyase subunit 4